MSLCLVAFLHNKHLKLPPVSSEGVTIDPLVKPVREVPKVLLGNRIGNPLTINNLLLGKRKVDGVLHLVLIVVVFDYGRINHLNSPKLCLELFIWSLCSAYGLPHMSTLSANELNHLKSEGFQSYLATESCSSNRSVRADPPKSLHSLPMSRYSLFRSTSEAWTVVNSGVSSMEKVVGHPILPWQGCD